MKWIMLTVLTLLTLGQLATADTTNPNIGLSVWSGYPESVKGFKAALAGAGFEEGSNVTYIYRNAGADRTKQTEIAKEFRDKNVDMVYTLTTPGTVLIKEYLPSTTPIVFSIVTYPADSGLIESFDYSGNNLVGTSNYVPLKSYVDLLKQLLPDAKTAAIFHRKGEPNSKIQAVGLSRLLKSSGVRVIDLTPESVEEVTAMAESIAEEADVFITTTDTLMQGGGEKMLISVSLKTNTPILSSNKQGIIDGSSFGPVADFYTLGKMSGEMAVRILKENKSPSSMTSRRQEPPQVLINRNSFDSLQLSLPETLTDYKYAE